MNYKIHPPRLPLQRNALRVEHIVSSVRCGLSPDREMSELLKTRFRSVMSNPSIHWQNFGTCNYLGECESCPVYKKRINNVN